MDKLKKVKTIERSQVNIFENLKNILAKSQQSQDHDDSSRNPKNILESQYNTEPVVKIKDAPQKEKVSKKFLATINAWDVDPANQSSLLEDSPDDRMLPKKAIQLVVPKNTSLNFEDTRVKKQQQNQKVDETIVEYRGMKMTISQREEYVMMEQAQIDMFKKSYYPAKFASKKNGVVASYAANTHQGMVRNYNEDRVSIILNIIQPKFKKVDYWPRCSFFAIYDGHGGSQCADFLRDQLHQMIVRDPNFPSDPKIALRNGVAEAEKEFLGYAHDESINNEVQRAGSCAIIVLIVGEIAYVANVGDSRAVMSVNGGRNLVQLTTDHKPDTPSEKLRIEKNGGRVYQNFSYVPDPSPDNPSGTQTLQGPFRVEPGRLSVSRTIGDIEAKDKRYGGQSDIVISTPEIRCFKILDNYDFILLGCDGIFEKLNNQDVVKCVMKKTLKYGDSSVHERCGQSVDDVLITCVEQKTLDNITVVIIGFNGFERMVSNRLNYQAHSKIQELKLDWETLETEVMNDEHYKMTKLQKPLESVIEEEASELESPKSQVSKNIAVIAAETSIMSSKRSSQVNAKNAPFDEIIRLVEDQAGPMELQQAGPQNKSKSVSGNQAQEEQKYIPKSISRDFIVRMKESPNKVRDTSNSRSGSGNGRRQIIVPNHKHYLQPMIQIPVSLTNKSKQIPQSYKVRKMNVGNSVEIVKKKPGVSFLRPTSPKQVQSTTNSKRIGSSENRVVKPRKQEYDSMGLTWNQGMFKHQATSQSFIKPGASRQDMNKTQRLHTDTSVEIINRQIKLRKSSQQNTLPAEIAGQKRQSGSRNAPNSIKMSFNTNPQLPSSRTQNSPSEKNRIFYSNTINMSQLKQITDFVQQKQQMIKKQHPSLNKPYKQVMQRLKDV